MTMLLIKYRENDYVLPGCEKAAEKLAKITTSSSRRRDSGQLEHSFRLSQLLKL